MPEQNFDLIDSILCFDMNENSFELPQLIFDLDFPFWKSYDSLQKIFVSNVTLNSLSELTICQKNYLNPWHQSFPENNVTNGINLLPTVNLNCSILRKLS